MFIHIEQRIYMAFITTTTTTTITIKRAFLNPPPSLQDLMLSIDRFGFPNSSQP
jgi:hypothetical protein